MSRRNFHRCFQLDDVIDEPLIGAHRDKEGAATALADYFLSELKKLRELSDEERMEKRYTKLVKPGAFKE